MPLSPDFKVRRLAAGDVSSVAAFERDIALISFPDDPITDLSFYAGKLHQAISDRKSWPLVAEIGGHVVSWAWISRRENFMTREIYADLRSLYVVSEHRGCGVGSRMLQVAIETCRNNDCLRVVARTSAANAAIQKILDRAGFGPKHVVFEYRIDGK